MDSGSGRQDLPGVRRLSGDGSTCHLELSVDRFNDRDSRPAAIEEVCWLVEWPRGSFRVRPPELFQVQPRGSFQVRPPELFQVRPREPFQVRPWEPFRVRPREPLRVRPPELFRVRPRGSSQV